MSLVLACRDVPKRDCSSLSKRGLQQVLGPGPLWLWLARLWLWRSKPCFSNRVARISVFPCRSYATPPFISCKPILKLPCSRAWEFCPLYSPETLMAFVLEKSTTKCDFVWKKERTEHMIPLAEKLTTGGGVDRR